MCGNQEIKFVTQFTNISCSEYNAPISEKGSDLLREMDQLSITVHSLIMINQ